MSSAFLTACFPVVDTQVGRIPEGVLSRITARVLQGLSFLHRKHLVGAGAVSLRGIVCKGPTWHRPCCRVQSRLQAQS